MTRGNTMTTETKKDKFFEDTLTVINCLMILVEDEDSEGFDSIGDGSEPLRPDWFLPMDVFFDKISDYNYFTTFVCDTTDTIDPATRAMMDAVNEMNIPEARSTMTDADWASGWFSKAA